MATTNKKTLEDAYNYQGANAGNQEGIKKLGEYKNLVNQKTSALSSLGQANKQALKYADTTALAQGYATQGAALQNVGNLQNAYMNQVGGINQQYQQQLGALQDTASANAFQQYSDAYSNAVAQGTMSNEELKKLQDAYYGQMNATDLTNAETFTRQANEQINTKVYQQEIASTYGVDVTQNGVATVEDVLNSSDKAKKILGKGAGNENELLALKVVLKDNAVKNGDTIKVGNNIYLFYNNQLYSTNKSAKTYTATINADQYRNKKIYEQALKDNEASKNK